MADSAKGHAALLIALGGKPKGMPAEDKSMEPGDEKDDLETSAIDDMFDALRSKDREQFRSALKQFVSSCVAKHMDDDAGDDEHEDY